MDAVKYCNYRTLGKLPKINKSFSKDITADKKPNVPTFRLLSIGFSVMTWKYPLDEQCIHACSTKEPALRPISPSAPVATIK